MNEKSEELTLFCLDPKSKNAKIALKVRSEKNLRRRVWTLGRDRNTDVCIVHVNVSRRHASIELNEEDDKWTVTDHNSSNGVFVDKAQIKPETRVEIRTGSVLRLHPTVETLAWKVEIAEETVEDDNDDDDDDDNKKQKKIEIEVSSISELSKDLIDFNAVYVHKDSQGNEVRSIPVKDGDEVTWYDKKRELKRKAEKPEDKIEAKKMKREESSEDKSAVIKNLKEKFNEDFGCTVCNEVFLSPMSLPCGHIFCKFCLVQWKKECSSRPFNCPNCREKVGREKVVPNYYLENLIDSWTKELGAEMAEARSKSVVEREKAIKEFEEAEEKKKEESLKSGGGRGRGQRRRGGGGGHQWRPISDYFQQRPSTSRRAAPAEEIIEVIDLQNDDNEDSSEEGSDSSSLQSSSSSDGWEIHPDRYRRWNELA